MDYNATVLPAKALPQQRHSGRLHVQHGRWHMRDAGLQLLEPPRLLRGSLCPSESKGACTSPSPSAANACRARPARPGPRHAVKHPHPPPRPRCCSLKQLRADRRLLGLRPGSFQRTLCQSPGCVQAAVWGVVLLGSPGGHAGELLPTPSTRPQLGLSPVPAQGQLPCRAQCSPQDPSSATGCHFVEC